MVESNEFDSFKLKLGNKGPLAEYNGIRFAGVFFCLSFIQCIFNFNGQVQSRYQKSYEKEIV